MSAAIITGASSGIGRDLALELARRGYDVAVCARRLSRLETLKDEIEALGRECLALEMDVTDWQSVQNAVGDLGREWQTPLELAVANAGVSHRMTMRKIDRDDAISMMRTNVEGVINLYAAVVPAMIERGAGHFAAISSISSFRGIPGLAVYSATKAAVRALMESTRVELNGTGVTAGVINPGFIRTEMTADTPMKMPFLMDADEAARRIADALEQRRAELNFPWQMTLFMRILRVVPRSVYEKMTGGFVRRRPE